MKKQKNRHRRQVRMAITVEDHIKAAKRGQREAEMEQLGPGFHSSDRTHRSRKTYTRKQKHRHRDEERW